MDDLQDPLPESNWTYRRWFSIGLVVVAMALVGLIVWEMTDALLVIVNGDADATATVNALASIAFYLVGLVLAVTVIYQIAPSGEQVVKMFQSVKLNLGGNIPTQMPRLPQRRPDPTARVTPDDPEE